MPITRPDTFIIYKPSSTNSELLTLNTYTSSYNVSQPLPNNTNAAGNDTIINENYHATSNSEISLNMDDYFINTSKSISPTKTLKIFEDAVTHDTEYSSLKVPFIETISQTAIDTENKVTDINDYFAIKTIPVSFLNQADDHNKTSNQQISIQLPIEVDLDDFFEDSNGSNDFAINNSSNTNKDTPTQPVYINNDLNYNNNLVTPSKEINKFSKPIKINEENKAPEFKEENHYIFTPKLNQGSKSNY